MSSNKSVREELERIYGKECFIEKLHLRQDDKPRKYKSKGQLKRMKQLTYHHILQKSKGGKATVENGAILCEENHIWFHSQSKANQDIMNKAFQEYKKSKECKVVFVDDLEVPFKIIPMEFSIDKKKEYNRAKEKAELRKIIEEGERC